jgi:hypothetical protein
VLFVNRCEPHDRPGGKYQVVKLKKVVFVEQTSAKARKESVPVERNREKNVLPKHKDDQK